MGNKKNIFLNIFAVFLILSLSIISFAEKPEDIKLENFVNDYANILTPEEEEAIASELIPLFNNNTAQISVVTINSLDGQDITSFAYQVAEGKLGDKEKNNGLLILVAVQDKKYRFEVGRGLEPYLNDAKIGRIGRDQIVPNFKNGDYYSGIYSSVLSIKSVLQNNVESTYYPTDKGFLSFNFYVWMFFVVFVVILLISELMANKTQNTSNINKKGNRKNEDDIFLAAGALASILRGGKGGSGGFGGFGGGGFGGGGAGGNW